MIDVSHEINSVERRVGTRTLEAGEARTVVVSRVFDTPLDDLWDACTNPERITRWFLPISGDLREGGRYAFQGNASGTIEHCEPPHAVHATWEYGGQTSWVELRLSAETEERARFVLEHIAHVDDDMWSQFGPGAVGVGWDMGVLGLALHLSGRDEMPDPAAAAAWQTSDEGRTFSTLSSEGWGEASIAAGTDPDEARAAAQRTTDAYTGQPAS